MKNSKTCPQCGDTRILRVEDGVGDRGIPLILGWFSIVPVARYVCTNCGYTESWVDKHHLVELRERYEKEKSKS